MAEIQNKTKSAEIDERLMELNSLFEISKTLSSNLNLTSVLGNILLTPMGRMMITRGVVLLHQDQNTFSVEAIKGLPNEIHGKEIEVEEIPNHPVTVEEIRDGGLAWAGFLELYGLKLVIPINSSNKCVGFLIFGEKLSGQEFNDKEIDFLVSLSNISATTISNSLMFEEIQQINRKLDQSNQGLNTLFEIGRELNSTLDQGKILKLLGFALMGQMLINKYAIFLKVDDNFVLEDIKGLKKLEECFNEDSKAKSAFMGLDTVYTIYDGSSEELDVCMSDYSLQLLIPMKIQDETKGIICFSDRINKKPFSQEDIEFLRTLANQAMISLENARLFIETLEKQRIEEELAVARDIQANLLPKNNPDMEGLDIDAINVSSKFVGGDYYDFIRINDNEIATIIADVSGKGVPASLLMSNLQASMHALVDVIDEPSKLTRKVNDIIYANTGADKFITFFFSRYNKETRVMDYCNAGHNHPFIISKEGEMKFMDQGGLILGMIPNVEYNSGSVQLDPGDVIVMYTDGISEALNEEEEEFEEPRLYEVCQENKHLGANALKDKILEAVDAHCAGYPQSDDITLIVLKVAD